MAATGKERALSDVMFESSLLSDSDIIFQRYNVSERKKNGEDYVLCQTLACVKSVAGGAIYRCNGKEHEDSPFFSLMNITHHHIN